MTLARGRRRGRERVGRSICMLPTKQSLSIGSAALALVLNFFLSRAKATVMRHKLKPSHKGEVGPSERGMEKGKREKRERK